MGLLSEVWVGVSATLAPQLAEHGLSLTEFEVLLRLARSPGRQLRMSDLSAQTSLSTSGITRVVDRLERDDLVERHACATDRRGLWAVLTSVGWDKLDATLTGHLALVDRCFTGLLDPQELECVLAALRVVRDAVRPEAVAGATGSALPAMRRPAATR